MKLTYTVFADHADGTYAGIDSTHDEMLRKFAGFELGSLRVVNKLVLELGDKRVHEVMVPRIGIRAVNVDSVVRTLLGRGLITEAYTDNETGAIHYETTDLMLVQLGINSIEELPQISPLLTDGSDGFDDVL